MYSVTDYGRMLSDRIRVDAYARALAAVVRPSSVVVDLGAGTGFFALLACQLGARKVYAIETNDAIGLLPALARRNGFADRIEILARPSTEVTLAERADVIVGDLRGVVPLFEANVAVMADARARLLAPGGVLLPARDALFAAVVEAPELHASVVSGWEGHPVDLTEARATSVNVFHHDRHHPIAASQLVTAGAAWGEITYGDPAPSLVEKTLELTATRAASAHGIVLWFDATLHGEIGFSTAPGSDRVYGRGFLPWENAVALEAGDAITLDLCARRGAGDHVWAWTTTIRRGAGARVVAVASFRQSTFFSVLASAQTLAKESMSYAPRLEARGQAVAAMLAAMTGESAVGELARRAHAAHPGAFASEAEALEEARRLAKKYG